LILGIIFCYTLPAAAQSTGSIRGSVLEIGSNEPISYATIRVLDSTIGTVTAKNGTFELSDLTPGNYRLEAAMLGFALLIKEVHVKAGKATLLMFTLEEERLELDDALVEASSMVGNPVFRRDIPGSVHILSSRTLDKFRYADMHRVLRQIPGVNIQEEDGYGLRPNIGLRGTGSERSSKITIMEDGILMAPAPYSAPAAYYFPTVGRAAGVEVRKGSSQIQYGPYTTGGAINLISRPVPARFSGLLTTTGGTNAHRKLHGHVGSSWTNAGFVIEAHHGQSDGFKFLDGGGNTGFDKTDYLAKFRLNTSPETRIAQALEIKLSRTDETSNETYVGLTDSDFAITPARRYAGSEEDVMRAEHQQISATHVVKPSDSVRITTSAYRVTFHRNWYKLNKVAGTSGGNAVAISDILSAPEIHPGEYEILAGQNSSGDNRLEVKANNRDYMSRGIQTTALIDFDAFGARHHLNIGGRLHYDEMDRFQWVDRYVMMDSGMSLVTTGIPGTDSNRIESSNAVSVYVQQETQIGRVKIIPGIRYEHVQHRRIDYGIADPNRTGSAVKERTNTIDAFIPGLGISAKITPSTLVFTGVHKGFSPPGSRDGAEPESSTNYEIGVRHSFGVFNSEITAFMNDYSNLLGADLAASGGTGSGDMFNGGSADVSGLELAATYNLGAIVGWRFSVPVTVTFTHTKAVFNTSFESDYEPWGTVDEGDILPYISPNQFSVGAGLEGKRFDLEIATSYVSEMRTVAGQGPPSATERTDAHFVIDISGGLSLSHSVRLFGSLRNLTDTIYIAARRPAGLRPGLPRTALVGLTVDF
jgi:Fe(3+) dicitrate transport protein